MTNDATDRRELDDNKDLEVLQEKLPQDYGPIEYVIAYNAQGRDFLITRKGNRTEDMEEDDEVWRVVNQALDLKRNKDAGSDFRYITTRLGTTEGYHVLMNTECRGYRCRPCRIWLGVSGDE